MNKIETFDGKYRFLSNFWKCNVTIEDITFPSAEHAYQAMKTLDRTIWTEFVTMTSGQAERKGQILKLRDNWDNIRLDIMYQVVSTKFKENKEEADLLLKTVDAELIEGNYWNDIYWGVCRGIGENHLGKILMRVRNELS